MAGWLEVARGTNLSDLQLEVADMELPKGTKMRVEMICPDFDWLFDLAGAEWVFQSQVPDGMELVDVWGENGRGIVEMEADPAWLVAVWLFIKAHWVALAIAGVLIWTIVSLIIISVKLPAVAAIPISLIVGIAIGIVGLTLLAARSPPRRAV